MRIFFLGRAVDSTLLCPIGAITSKSAKSTKEILKQKQQLLDFTKTQEDAIIAYRDSNSNSDSDSDIDMKLAVHSNTSSLS